VKPTNQAGLFVSAFLLIDFVLAEGISAMERTLVHQLSCSGLIDNIRITDI
jgi:hypothetical protein